VLKAKSKLSRVSPVLTLAWRRRSANSAADGDAESALEFLRQHLNGKARDLPEGG
jgi:hypothetical protein